MKVAVFSARPFDRRFLDAANGGQHELVYFDTRLDCSSAALAEGCEAVSCFVNDVLDGAALQVLARGRVRLVALRCTGFNNVDLESARTLGIAVARVPAYSPQAVAEHTVALMLSLNRNVHRAYARVREGDFDMCGRTVGIVGTGQIGMALARILHGFGCKLLAVDPAPGDELVSLGGRYVALGELLRESDIVSLHCPLVPETRHLIDRAAVGQMKPGAMLLNTSRGAVVDTQAVIAGLKTGQIGRLGLDVYEEEAGMFFDDHSDQLLLDDVFARLLTFPNVLITGHQAFFTEDALRAIAETTIANITAFAGSGEPLHVVRQPAG
jgi:D-lactate dehydrogenase